MIKHFRGEVNYNPEIDRHFPHLTVGQTLEFAAALLTPHTRLDGLSRDEWARNITKLVMKLYGLSHAKDTKVGDEYVRGVSGGERKRVSIAEMTLSGSAVACWDQSTRGLDSSSALHFVKSLKGAAEVMGSCHLVSLYQASDSILYQFDKVIVLYEGREIYFGPVTTAQAYFEEMGWQVPPKVAVSDFLTSVTNSAVRRPRLGYQSKVPRTPDDFVRYWLASREYRSLLEQISDQEKNSPPGLLEEFTQSMKSKMGPHARRGSPYLVGTRKQIQYCAQRAFHRLWNDKTATVTTAGAQIVMSLIVGSMFYRTPNTNIGFFSKGGVLFGAIMMNAMSTITEIFQLYTQRPIVEKQASYALYRPWTEAVSGWMLSLPLKLAMASTFNISLYFLAGLREEPSIFFIFFLFLYTLTLVMSCIFRTIGAATKVLPQAFAVVGVVLPLLVIYTGYVIPKPSMHPWFKWITYINPVGYAFESLVANEFHGENFSCAVQSIVPPYGPSSGTPFVCSSRGAVENQLFISGDAFMFTNFQYVYSHLWRNYGILLAILAIFLLLYLAISNVNIRSPISSSALVYRKGHVPTGGTKHKDIKASTSGSKATMGFDGIRHQSDTFSWHDICFTIPVKGGSRRLLDEVSGYVKPGTLTALMVSTLSP
jgi:ABC-type multidrug transport system permease subunit/ABC-type multidrug transport system ATPase subunit